MLYLHRLREQIPIQVLRWLPVPPPWKRLLVWVLSPRRVIAAVAVIRDERGRILVLRSSWLHAWQLPGGTVASRETPLQALYREVQEETGRCVVQAGQPAIDARGALPRVVFVYSVTIDPGPVRLSAEHTGWAYLPSDALPPHIKQLLQGVSAPDAPEGRIS